MPRRFECVVLKAVFLTDVLPLIVEARLLAGGALDPIATYRASGYGVAAARERPAVEAGSAGIVQGNRPE
jgi:L-rhamnose isomerase/sugar isomerase